MRTKHISTMIVAVVAVVSAIVVGIDLFGGMDQIYIGLLRGQEDFFLRTDRMTETTGKKVVIRYYENYGEMKSDVLSGALDIYVSPLFEHIADPKQSLAIASIKADYILAGMERKSPTPIGVTEYHISKLLIGNAKALSDKKYTSLLVKEAEQAAFLKEEVIDFAIFRNEIPADSGYAPIIALSELGFEHDVLCVRQELLLRHDALIEAIFLSSSLDGHLPPESEVRQAIQYLFQSGAIKERKRYTDYVYMK